MKTLREYQLNVSGSHEGEGITWAAPFTPPIHAMVGGVPVRVLNIGDLPGASTVYNCADESGFSTPVKQADTIFTDGTYLPLKGGLQTPSTR